MHIFATTMRKKQQLWGWAILLALGSLLSIIVVVRQFRFLGDTTPQCQRGSLSTGPQPTGHHHHMVPIDANRLVGSRCTWPCTLPYEHMQSLATCSLCTCFLFSFYAGRDPQLEFSGLGNTTGPFDAAEFLAAAVRPYRPFIARTRTNPSFWLAIYRSPDGSFQDFAESIALTGMWEVDETRLFYSVLQECHPGARVLDVGGFVGYFAILSASKGCMVDVWEGHPHNALLTRISVAVNGLYDRVTVHNRIATDSSDPVTFSGEGMDGHVAGSYLESDNPARKAEIERLGIDAVQRTGYPVYPLGIDQHVPSGEVLLLKVDVEGYEPRVLRSARQLLAQRRVKYIVFEYNQFRAMKTAEGVQMVMDLIGFGYKVYQMPAEYYASKGPECNTTRRIESKEQLMQLTHELQQDTYKCGRYCVYLLGVRDHLPQHYVAAGSH